MTAGRAAPVAPVLPDGEGRVEVGDYVTIAAHPHPLTWSLRSIESEIDPNGVILISGQTGRLRRANYADLHLYRKGL